MREERNPNSAAIPVALAVIFGALLAAYVVGYFTLPIYTQSATERFRGFRHEWQIAIYWPCAQIESSVTGMKTDLWNSGFEY